MEAMDVIALKQWFLAHRRDLPWRRDPTPYKVWVSEVMLQQTQVATVIPYFERWMRHYPTIESVAQAPIEELTKLWEGLGYYTRVRQMHLAALYLLKYHEGELPSSSLELAKVPGIGPYTAGAILSFAFHQKAIAVDGNVARVLARYMACEEEISSPKARQLLWKYGEKCLPDEEPWVVVEALIELGATVCTREPKCFSCPLSGGCVGLQRGIADLLPIKKKRALITCLNRYVPVLISDGHVLLKKEQVGKVMGGLYQFPYFEVAEHMSEQQVEGELWKQWALKADFQYPMQEVSHHFTRYQAMLYPSLWVVDKLQEVQGYEWIEKFRLKALPFSAGHRQILTQLMEIEHAHFTY